MEKFSRGSEAVYDASRLVMALRSVDGIDLKRLVRELHYVDEETLKRDVISLYEIISDYKEMTESE